MRNKHLTLSAVVVILGFLPNIVWAGNGRVLTSPITTSPITRSPVGSATVPVSSYRSGLHRSPNPIDRTSNLIVTGNVGGGRHFRGTLPYNAVSDFGGTLNTSTLDAFLRRSDISQNYYRSSYIPTPYYSQTATVTRTDPGNSLLIRPPSSKIRTQTGRTFDLLSRSQQTKALKTNDDIFKDQLKYIDSLNPQSENLFTERADSKKNHELNDQNYKEQLQKFKTDLNEFSEKVNQLDQDLNNTDQPELYRDKTETRKLQKDEEPEQKLDIYEQMKQQLKQSQQEYLEEYVEEKRQEAEEQSLKKKSELLERSLTYKQAPKIKEPKEEEEKEGPEEKPRFEQMSQEDISKEAERILEHRTFAAYTDDEFNKHLLAAEDYLKLGKFYQAAGSYNLAGIYKPQDPLVYAGKSHALFAAGEYLSSAASLSRTLELFPDYAKFKIDIVSMMGDIDMLEKRIADTKQWYEISNAPQLQFLLSYIYLQMDRQENAEQSIDAAYKELPDSKAVIMLKQAIDQKTKN